MKKNFFLILISSLFIFFLIYFYDKRETILNKEYLDDKNNVHIEYPYFNDPIIDEYLNSYLNQYIKEYNPLSDSLFIDYDYQEYPHKIDLLLYFFVTEGNMIKTDNCLLEIDRNTSTIKHNRLKKKNPNLDYDGYVQKLVDKEKPMIALTFDDGPNHNTIKVLDILERYGVKATFFILGSNIKGNEKIITKMDQAGMELGNHMYSHKLITKLPEQKIKDEIMKVDQLIFDIVGKNPSLIRPSYGTFNKKINRLMDRPIIIWNVDTLDWKYHNSKRIASKVVKQASDGDIILMHDIYNATANSLEIFLPKLIDKGYQFVTVSELLYYKGISPKKGKVYSNANK